MYIQIGAATNSTTVIIPPGTTNHGNPNLVCFPAQWTNVVIFFLGNYATHAATVITVPGSSILSTFLRVSFALCFPGSGASIGIQAILSWAVFAPTDLQKAARAGALCHVVRTDEYDQSPLEQGLHDCRPCMHNSTSSQT